MDLSRKEFTFTDGRKISVSESTWETATRRSQITETERARQAQLNGSGDPDLFFFVEEFYSYMASCTSGDIPSPEEALSLSAPDLDGWLLAVIEVNPESFIKVDRKKRGEVTFRDGSRFEIVSSHLPSVTMKRKRLESEALKREPDPDHPTDVFAVYLYPILASCTLGDVPSIDEIRNHWPETELYKWRDAIEAINPHWFYGSGTAEEATRQDKEITKKKEKRPRRSPPS